MSKRHQEIKIQQESRKIRINAAGTASRHTRGDLKITIVTKTSSSSRSNYFKASFIQDNFVTLGAIEVSDRIYTNSRTRKSGRAFTNATKVRKCAPNWSKSHFRVKVEKFF
ncbi:hypothetical protein H6H03_30495 [Nostoc paludosum FACHB-159]|uniref:Uncharacterized protein n=1 Tax=Nostoc paludosum FACHB-159 TaxID=2692908 RepID=A0ABR8KH30_9NOSO|nr:hypothetical protein [Nostoc sp. FACHB-857]MBD2738161.1 hypothetical protein [Nostoc paludosum FACHB-159]